jgi:hypothetical protein
MSCINAKVWLEESKFLNSPTIIQARRNTCCTDGARWTRLTTETLSTLRISRELIDDGVKHLLKFLDRERRCSHRW